MSSIERLTISAVRNLNDIAIEPSSRINLFYGQNGSGKTSLLEAIHILASGRSFRSAKLDSVVQEGSSASSLFAGLTNGRKIGLARPRKAKQLLKLDGDNQKSWEQVARQLPVQVLDSHSFRLLEGGPQQRRQFLDWGVFHVEPNFVHEWRKSKRSISQRNLLLKSTPCQRSHLEPWTVEFCKSGEEIHRARQNYFEQFKPVFHSVYRELSPKLAEETSLSYDRGWSLEQSLEECLERGIEADMRYGATQSGPHRADLKILQNGVSVADVYSRGQQKVLICALKIAQGMLYSKHLEVQCIYLVDDLPAELDRNNRIAVLKMLSELGGQLFLTSIEKEILDEFASGSESLVATFHVERGTITD